MKTPPKTTSAVTILALVAILSSGCANIGVEKTSTAIDGTVTTTKLHNTYFLAKSQITQLSVDKMTKTTSQLIGAGTSNTAGDPETINALNSLFAEVLVKALKSGAPVP